MNSFLFARQTFWSGWGQLLDFANTMFAYNDSLTPEQADFLAMRLDWKVIGDDLRKAIEQAREEDRERQPQLL